MYVKDTLFRQKRLEEKANHRHYEKLATEEDYTCSLGNSDVGENVPCTVPSLKIPTFCNFS